MKGVLTLLEEKDLIKISKKYLTSTNVYDRKLIHLQNKLKRLKYLSVNISPSTNSCYVKKDKSNDRLACIIDDIVDLEREIIATKIQLANLQDEISYKISQLKDNDQQMVLFYRYIDQLAYKVIAINMDYSESNIYIIHRKALINFIVNNEKN